MRELIEPYLEKLKKSNLSPEQEIYLSILDSNLKDISSPFIRSMAIKYAGLTHKEIQVAGLVKEGKKTKEIAKLLNTTKRAVEFHRHSLRTKLGL
ncbi:MAG: helix-turn-helix transcriptional regulator, partial [Proteobacteria bacterium]|nr:helix-turn-helix transcriptional regulator [Pseudomonadota bacterium]